MDKLCNTQPFYFRAVANGQVGPVLVGPIIFIFLSGIIIEPGIFLDIIFETETTQSP